MCGVFFFKQNCSGYKNSQFATKTLNFYCSFLTMKLTIFFDTYYFLLPALKQVSRNAATILSLPQLFTAIIMQLITTFAKIYFKCFISKYVIFFEEPENLYIYTKIIVPWGK